MLISLFPVVQLVNNSLLRTLLPLTANVWAVASFISTLFPGKKGAKCSSICYVFQGMDWSNNMAGESNNVQTRSKQYPGNFFFFFPSTRSASQTPGSLDSRDALVNVQWEKCQIEGFLSATVQNHHPCLKIVILDRTCIPSVWLLAAGRRAYALVPKSWLFGGFIIVFCVRTFCMFLCYKFFRYFSLQGLPRKRNINNCKSKSWKPANHLGTFYSIIDSLHYRLMWFSVQKVTFSFSQKGDPLPGLVFFFSLRLNQRRHFGTTGFVYRCFVNSKYASFSQPYVI